MAVTYDLIATATPAGTTTATFNNLGSYTDLILQCYMSGAGGAGADIYMRINGDTASNYYALQGSSTSTNTFDNASMNAGSGIPLIGLQNSPQGTPDFNLVEITMPEYANTNVVKNVNIRFGYISNPTTPAANVGFGVSNWRNSNAITTFSIFVTGGTFATGTTINLYGVTAGNA
jgi:hypothetical protein